MEDNEKKFIAIMLFYIILSYVVGPYVYYIYVCDDIDYYDI